MKSPFRVDDKLIMHSPYQLETEPDWEVVYRGPMQDKAVVYRVESGWQGVVPFEWLRLAGSPPNTASTGQERDSSHEPALSNSTHVPAQGA